jgi:AcrR family transcriptional regulator
MSKVVASTDTLAESGKSARQEEILLAATSLFAEHGFNDADTQALADQLGIGKGTIYRCFPSKRELFLAAVDRVMRLLWTRLEASSVGVSHPLERVAKATLAYLDFFNTNPSYVELLIQERALFKDRKKPTYFEHRERNAESWRSLYRDLIKAGRIREMPVDQIRDVMNYLVYGAMFTNFFNGSNKSAKSQAIEILDVVFHGILTGPERKKLSGKLDDLFKPSVPKV